MRSICMGSVNHAAPCLTSVAIDLHDCTMPPVWHFPLDHQGLGQTVGGNFRLAGATTISVWLEKPTPPAPAPLSHSRNWPKFRPARPPHPIPPVPTATSAQTAAKSPSQIG